MEESATSYPGIPDRFEVKCPLCFADLTIVVTTAEVRRVISEDVVSNMEGKSWRYPGNQRVDAEIHASIHHTCPKIPVVLTQFQTTETPG